MTLSFTHKFKDVITDSFDQWYEVDVEVGIWYEPETVGNPNADNDIDYYGNKESYGWDILRVIACSEGTSKLKPEEGFEVNPDELDKSEIDSLVRRRIQWMKSEWE